jgi:peptidoglycan/LPS O-acetylase OafA/YrhL
MTPFLLLRYNFKKALIIASALFIISVAIDQSTGLIDSRLPQYLVPFAAGVMLARTPFPPPVSESSLLRILSLAVIYPLFWCHDHYEHWAVRLVAIELILLASLPVFFSIASFISSRVISPKVAAQLSYCSFGMYLLHRITFGTAVFVYRPTTLIPALLYLYGLVLTATAIAAWLFQWAYDYTWTRLLLSRKS